MKYSKENNRDFNFYLKNRHVFTFSGTLHPKNEALYNKDGVTGKESFFSIENNGKNKPTKHPNILKSLLQTKAAVNFQIKQWAEGRADGTLPLFEFSKRKYGESSLYNPLIVEQSDGLLEWVNGEPVYYKDVETRYNLPEWVVEAVENQKKKYYDLHR